MYVTHIVLYILQRLTNFGTLLGRLGIFDESFFVFWLPYDISCILMHIGCDFVHLTMFCNVSCGLVKLTHCGTLGAGKTFWMLLVYFLHLGSYKNILAHLTKFGSFRNFLYTFSPSLLPFGASGTFQALYYI